MSENCRKCAGRLVAAKLQTLTELARLARFERATAWFVARYSPRTLSAPHPQYGALSRWKLMSDFILLIYKGILGARGNSLENQRIGLKFTHSPPYLVLV